MEARLGTGARALCVALVFQAAVLTGGAGAVSVVRGQHFGARIFPDNAFTVRDRAQVTGRRVHFRLGVDYPLWGGRIRRRCTGADYSICDGFAGLDKLDGFDIQPRVQVPLTGAIRLSSVNATDFYISNTHGAFVSSLL